METQKICAKDIDRLTIEQIKSIDPKLVYEWVKTGKWNRLDFMKWLNVTVG